MDYIFGTLMAIVAGLFVLYPFYLIIFTVEKIHARRRGWASRMAWSTFMFYLVVSLGGVATVHHAMKLTPCGDRSLRARSNLGAIWTGQIAYHGEYNTYGRTFEQIAWAPEGWAYYSYYLADDFDPCDDPKYNCGPQSPFQSSWNLPVSPLATRDNFVALAIGNLDGDSAFDVWMINEKGERKRVYDDERDEYAYEFVKDRLSWWDKLGRAMEYAPQVGWILLAVLYVVVVVLLGRGLVRDVNCLVRRKPSDEERP